MKDELEGLGLTESEARIYASVLRIGVCTVKQIAKDTGFHRTNIYDVLEQLKEKGVMTFVKEGKVMKYRISDPQNLYGLLQEKRELLDGIFPKILGQYKSSAEDVQVEVHKGAEGMKSAFRDMARESMHIYAFGVKGQLREKLPVFAQQLVGEWKRKGVKYYGIYTERGNAPGHYEELRYVSSELSGPVATFIYGDKININIWEPTLIAIVVKSRMVAQMYKKHFDLLWKIAKK